MSLIFLKLSIGLSLRCRLLLENETFHKRRHEACTRQDSQLNVSLRLYHIRFRFDVGQDLASLACEVVPRHQSKEDGEEYLIPMNTLDMCERDVH